MSHNSFHDRYLSCEDDEFVLKVDKDIRDYLINFAKNSVLLFPPVNSYRRFLIHKVCETITANQTRALSTFSIGAGSQRRTVICHRYQLLVDLKNVSLKRSEEAEFTWHYVKRNSVSKHTGSHRVSCDMGVEKALQVDDKSPSSQRTIEDIDTDQSLIDANSSSDDPLKSTAKRALSSRTRRPDRAVYVPRAKRSQTTPPSSSTGNHVSPKSHNRKSDKSKSKSIDENHSTSNSEDADSSEVSINPPFLDVAVNSERLDSAKFSDCDLIKQNDQQVIHSRESTNEKNQKNLNNLSTMSEQTKVLTIESAGGIDLATVDKDDKDEKELIKASQEINRSNRKLIKQTFNSNVLEIEAAEGVAERKEEDNAVNKDEDDWDALFDDNGDCLDPKMIEELTMAVGKVSIDKPKSDYKAYQANVDLLSGEEHPHVLECSNFPVEFRTQDLMMLFSQYKESGFDIKWVDDTHCLVIFSSARVAAEVLTISHSFVRLKPLKEATAESRAKAKKCSHSLQPYKQRPETCAALAKRLVSGALGVRVKATSEERENERRVLREAKERKLLAAKQREEMWNN